tara:strand:+ start:1429 stop:1779 length:351 start_codon:yes stop_codon:yes gene_type:complete
MKIKQLLLIIFALTLSATFLYPIYVNSEKEKYCNSLKDEITVLEKESSDKDIEILKLKNSMLETENELTTMYDEVKRLSDENGLLTSVFSEIEGQPGGHEILEYLWNQKDHTKYCD